jgi:hypothetical protein
MRYPPALRFTPRASWVYGAMALLITIIFIAACAVSMPASGSFSCKSGIFMALAGLSSAWLLFDAWKKPKGSLHYAQGQWHWAHESQEIAGTLRLHLDLQSYMLVSFKTHSTQKQLFQTKTQWFHLEVRHADHAASPAHAEAWLALRRAVYSPMEPADEAVAT